MIDVVYALKIREKKLRVQKKSYSATKKKKFLCPLNNSGVLDIRHNT